MSDRVWKRKAFARRGKEREGVRVHVLADAGPCLSAGRTWRSSCTT